MSIVCLIYRVEAIQDLQPAKQAQSVRPCTWKWTPDFGTGKFHGDNCLFQVDLTKLFVGIAQMRFFVELGPCRPELRVIGHQEPKYDIT